MKIVHLASEYPPQKVFGLGRFVRDLATAQAACGHEVHVLTNSFGGRDYDIVQDGVRIHRIETYCRLDRLHRGPDDRQRTNLGSATAR